MVNLLGRPAERAVPPALDEAQRARIAARRALLLRLHAAGRLAEVNARLLALSAELDEFGVGFDPLAAEALLAAIDGVRESFAADVGPIGAEAGGADEFVCHRPGRSLATGEAEIASRGYFDGEDRPPMVGWVGVIASGRERGAFGASDGFAILAWVAPEDRARAQAGVRACPTGALERLVVLAPSWASALESG